MEEVRGFIGIKTGSCDTNLILYVVFERLSVKTANKM